MKTGQAGHYLAWVDREIDGIVAVRAEWESGALPVEDRLATVAEWDDVVSRYLAVVAAFEARQLTTDEERHLRRQSARLAQLVPTLERMRLRRPDPATLARLGAVVAS